MREGAKVNRSLLLLLEKAEPSKHWAVVAAFVAEFEFVFELVFVPVPVFELVV